MPQPDLSLSVAGGALLAPLSDEVRARLAPWHSPELATVVSLRADETLDGAAIEALDTADLAAGESSLSDVPAELAAPRIEDAAAGPAGEGDADDTVRI